MTVQTADILIEFFEKYNQVYRDMVAFLTQKQAKVMADDLLWLLDSIDEEQAHVMKIQSEEKQRLSLFADLSLTDMKSKELIEEAPDERKAKLGMEIDILTNNISEIRRLNSDITSTVERKLAVQEEIVRKTGMTKTETYNGYGAKIRKTNTNKSFLGNI